jgi:hypothetical protein
MRFPLYLIGFTFCFAACAADTLTFSNGEKLIGHLVRATAKSVTFKSDMAGEVTVDWGKVSELETAGAFAVIPATVKVQSRKIVGEVPQGTVVATAEKIEVKPAEGGAPVTLAVSQTAYVVKETEFTKTMEGGRLLGDWKGAVSGGVSLVQATQNSRTFTGAMNLSRVAPEVDWLARKNRTTADFTVAYGKLTSPGTAAVKTEIYHADAERDEYFASAVYGFGQVVFDHNFSQGLDLQQLYGGGIGWTAVKKEKAHLDLKGSVSHIRQTFNGGHDQSLIGATFGDTFMCKLIRGIVLHQALTITPAFNNSNAYSALTNASLVFPAYKRLSFSLNTEDTFLNNPPPGFRKNSFLFTVGLGYTLH